MRYAPFLLVVLVMGIVSCDEHSVPAEPDYSTTNPSPIFSTGTARPGQLLATTNRAELLEVDLGAGTVSLIGRAVLEGNPQLGWTDLASDVDGNILAVTNGNNSQLVFPVDCLGGWYGDQPCFRVFVIDAGTGAILAEVGSTEATFVGEIDFGDDGTLYAAKFIDERQRGDGGLGVVNPSTGLFTLIGRFGPGFGEYDLEAGGFSVHPQTAELWGVESNFAAGMVDPALYRIDSSTGHAEERIRLGLNGIPLGPTGHRFGFSALEILPDGTFLCSGGGSSNIYRIEAAPDPTSGLAELTLLPLSYDPAIVGKLNGLDYVRYATPSDLLGDVAQLIAEEALEENKTKSLISKINGAQKFIDAGKTEQAVHILGAFINQVEGYINGGKVSPENGQTLIDRATDLIQQLQS